MEHYSDYKGAIAIITWMSLKSTPSEGRQTSKSVNSVTAFM